MSVDSIVTLAANYAAASPALLRCGWGLERNRNGLASVAAVLALPAVAGKFAIRGGGYTLSNSAAVKVDAEVLAGIPEPGTRVLNMNRLGRCLLGPLDPPVRALFVYNCNPAATVPGHALVIAGLRREDLFTVVHEQVWTDTARYADIVLPATTFLEHMELSKSYGSYGLHFSDAVIPAEGEAKPNAEVFQLLGRAMGWDDGLVGESQERLLEAALSAVRGALADGTKSVAHLRASNLAPMDFPGPAPVQFQTVFPGTAHGKIDLYPAVLGGEPYRFLGDPASADYPLALISPASSRSISSTLAELNWLDARLEMNPEDAAQRGISEGATARVFNQLGEVHCRVKLDERLRPGVVSLAKGIWRRATMNGAVGNSLVPDDVTPISGGACFNDARVQVAKLPSALAAG